MNEMDPGLIRIIVASAGCALIIIAMLIAARHAKRPPDDYPHENVNAEDVR